MVRSQVEEQLPGLPQYHFRFSDGSGDVKQMRGFVPVAPQQEASELAEHTAYLALGPARTAVSRDAEVLTAGDAPNPFVRGFAPWSVRSGVRRSYEACRRRRTPGVAGIRVSNRLALGLVQKTLDMPSLYDPNLWLIRNHNPHSPS